MSVGKPRKNYTSLKKKDKHPADMLDLIEQGPRGIGR